jgi:hypothetical protein
MMYSSLFFIGIIASIVLFILSVKENILIFRAHRRMGFTLALVLCTLLLAIQMVHSFIGLYLINTFTRSFQKNYLIFYNLPILAFILYFSWHYWSNGFFKKNIRIVCKNNLTFKGLGLLFLKKLFNYKKFFLIFLTLSSFSQHIVNTDALESYFILCGLTGTTSVLYLFYLLYLQVGRDRLEEHHLIFIQKMSGAVLIFLGVFIIYSSLNGLR